VVTVSDLNFYFASTVLVDARLKRIKKFKRYLESIIFVVHIQLAVNPLGQTAVNVILPYGVVLSVQTRLAHVSQIFNVEASSSRRHVPWVVSLSHHSLFKIPLTRAIVAISGSVRAHRRTSEVLGSGFPRLEVLLQCQFIL
jgi:hypothetical protein